MTAARFSHILSSRPWRFAMLAFAIALIFSGARLLTLSLMIIFLVIAAIGAFRKNSLFLTSLIIICAAGILLHILSIIDTGRVRSYMDTHTPPDPAAAQNGTFEGTGQGPRGPTGSTSRR